MYIIQRNKKWSLVLCQRLMIALVIDFIVEMNFDKVIPSQMDGLSFSIERIFL